MRVDGKIYYGMLHIFVSIYNLWNVVYLLNRLRKGKVKMGLGPEQFYYVSLCEEMHSIQLSISLHEKHPFAEQRIELMEFIESKLNFLMKEFMQASTKPKAYVPCFFQKCNTLHVELEMVHKGEYQNCPSEEKTIPQDYYRDLFINQGL